MLHSIRRALLHRVSAQNNYKIFGLITLEVNKEYSLMLCLKQHLKKQHKYKKMVFQQAS